MGSNVLVDARLIVGANEISTQLNNVLLTQNQDLLPNDCFGTQAFHTFQAGLVKVGMKGSGYVDPVVSEEVIVPKIAAQTVDVPISAAAEGGDAGEAAFFFKGTFAMYEAGASIGEMHKFDFSAENTGARSPLLRGQVFNAGRVALTAAGNSATRTFAAVGATQRVFANLHVISFTGSNVIFTLNSATTDWGTPVLRWTSATYNAIGSEWMTPIAGPIATTFWRLEYTGTLTSVKVFFSMGIGQPGW